MIIAGGTYRETCVTPAADMLLGSGGRATLALREVEREAVLHTFYPDAEDVRANFGHDSVVHRSLHPISFHYLHPMARPVVTPMPLPEAGSVAVNGETIIRFGCLEGNFVVTSDTAIYDPQSGGRPEPFGENGSQTRRLALILNSSEAQVLSGEDDLTAAALQLRQSAEVVIIKQGPAGALVVGDAGMPTIIPAYRTHSVFKIGSGDVFTAMFAHYWATVGRRPEEAADLASRHVATYVANRTLPCTQLAKDLEPARGKFAGRTVQVAVDGQSSADEWLFYEIETGLKTLGAGQITRSHTPYKVSDAHDIIYGAARDQDGHAIELVSQAAKLGIPYVLFAERQDIVLAAKIQGLKVLQDFAGSLYAAAWGGV